MTSAAERSKRSPLSREAVLAGALDLLDRVGLDAFSMRALGAHLGVDPMAIYYYFPSRTALLDGLVEQVMAQVDQPELTGDWRRDAAASIRAFRVALLAHPEAVPLVAMRPPVSPSAFDATEALLEALAPAGLSPRETLNVAQMLGRMTVGHVVGQAGPPPGADRDGREVAHSLAASDLPAERFPRIARVYADGYEIDHDMLFDQSVEATLRHVDTLTSQFTPPSK